MCSHEISAVLHCLNNFNASLFLAFAFVLCCKVPSDYEGDTVEQPVKTSHAVVLHWCASSKSVVAVSSGQEPL